MENGWRRVESSLQQAFNTVEGLDDRLVQGLKRMGFQYARPVQILSFAHACAGADILLKAPTGTGKTLAYAVPVVNSLVSRLLASDGMTVADYMPGEATNSLINWRHRYEAIILAPSRELVHQISGVMNDLCYLFTDLIRPVGLTECPKQIRDLAAKLAASNILITNPGALVAAARLIARSLPKAALKNSSLTLIFPNVKHLIVDEADLILSVYGYEDEISLLFSPSDIAAATTSGGQGGGGGLGVGGVGVGSISICATDHLSSRRAQVMLVSATINQDLKKMKEMALYKPKVLTLLLGGDELASLPAIEEIDDPKNPGADFEFIQLDTESQKKCDHRFIIVDRNRSEDYLCLSGILKENHFSMNEESPRTLVFVNSPVSAVRCQLVLQSFGLKAERAIGTQKLKRRLGNLEKFNSGLIDVLITMDSEFLLQPPPSASDDLLEEGVVSSAVSPKKKIRRKDSASLLSRGLDYKQVARVVLLEPAASLDDYIHKVGRCGRDQTTVNALPTALSILSAEEASSHSAWTLQIMPRYQPTLPDDFTIQNFVKYQYRCEDFVKKASKQTIKKILDSDT